MTAESRQTDPEVLIQNIGSDLTSFIIDRIRNNDKMYKFMSESEQRALIGDTTRAVIHHVRDIVRRIAADDRPVIVADLKQATIKDEIVAQISVKKSDPKRFDLVDCVGSPVLLVVADHERYLEGIDDAVKPDSDQKSLIDDEDDAA